MKVIREDRESGTLLSYNELPAEAVWVDYVGCCNDDGLRLKADVNTAPGLIGLMVRPCDGMARMLSEPEQRERRFRLLDQDKIKVVVEKGA